MAVVLVTAASVCVATEPEIYVKYSKFVALVERGKVISLSIDDTGKIEGVYRGAQGDLTFWSHWPGRPVEDTLLRRLLREHPSAVEFRTPVDPEEFLWMSLVGFLIDSIVFPVVTLVLLFRVFRRLKSLERRLPG
jgi:hypothetical protein